MTITAKFPGICRKCRQTITVGQEINWDKGAGSQHVTCPTGQAEKPETTTLVEPAPVGIVQVFATRNRGAVSVGYTFKTKEGILTVIRVTSRWISQNEVDDQDDFRCGGDPFYEYRATCREATAEEAAPIIEREQSNAAQASIRQRLEQIVRQVRQAANYVDNSTLFPMVEGVETAEVVLGTITKLSVRGNGIWVYESTYDDSHIWRIDYDAALADEIRHLAPNFKA